MSNKRETPRGATLRVEKEPRQWNITLPAIAWQWLLIPVVAVAVFWSGREAYQSWPIEQIEVSGRLSAWQADDLAENISWVKGESFFSLDMKKVYSSLAGLPLVHQVTVRKRWPDTVEVKITEDVPMALWNDNQLLSVSGRISDIPTGLNTDGLTRIEGQQINADTAMRYFRRIQQNLTERELKIERLSVDTVGAVEVRLSNGWLVKFGRQYFEERLHRLERLLAKLPQEKVRSLDLRYGKGAAIAWRSEQEMG